MNINLYETLVEATNNQPIASSVIVEIFPGGGGFLKFVDNCQQYDFEVYENVFAGEEGLIKRLSERVKIQENEDNSIYWEEQYKSAISKLNYAFAVCQKILGESGNLLNKDIFDRVAELVERYRTEDEKLNIGVDKCPFCGEYPDLIKNSAKNYYIVCYSCGAKMDNNGKGFALSAKAVYEWNKRI